MKLLSSDILKSTLLRYLLVGAISFAIELSAMYLFILLGALDIIAVAIAFWVGLIVSFLFQKIYTFENHTTRVRHLTAQSIGYGSLVIVNYGFTLIFVAIFSPIIGILIARTVALVITTVWNFIIYKKIIFRKLNNS